MAKNQVVLGVQTNKAEFVRQFNEAGEEARKQLLDELDKVNNAAINTTVVLDVRADDSGIKKLVARETELNSKYNEANGLLERARKIQDGSLTSLRGQIREATQARDQTAQYVTSLQGGLSILKQTNPEWTKANEKVQRITRELQLAGASSFWDRLKADLNLGGFLKAGGAINSLVNTFQSLSILVGQTLAPINALGDSLNRLQSIELTLESIGQGPAQVGQIFQQSTDIATKYGVSLNAVREGFTKLTPTVTASGGTLDQVGTIIDALSSRFAAFGLSGDNTKRVMNGIIQAFGKGKLQAEELTQQISEADPAFRVDFAKALLRAKGELDSLGSEVDGTVQNLGELVKQGKITSDVLLKVLPYTAKASAAFGALGPTAATAFQAFAEGKVTVQQLQTQIANLGQLNLETLAKSVKPLLGVFFAVQGVVADFVKVLLDLESTKFITDLLTDIAKSALFVFNAITTVVSAVLNLIDPIFGLINAINKWIPVTKIIGGLIVAYLGVATLNLAKNGIKVLIASIAQLIAVKGGWVAASIAATNALTMNAIPAVVNLGRSVAGALIPPLLRFVAVIKTQLLGALASMVVSLNAVGLKGAGSFVAGIGQAAGGLLSLVPKAKAAGQAAKNAGQAAAGAGQTFTQGAFNFGLYGAEAIGAAGGASQLLLALGDVGEGADDAAKGVGGVAKTANNAAITLGKGADAAGDTASAFANAGVGAGGLGIAGKAAGISLGVMGVALAAVAAVAAVGAGAWYVYDQVNGEANKTTEQFVETLKDLKAKYDQLKESQRAAATDSELFTAAIKKAAAETQANGGFAKDGNIFDELDAAAAIAQTDALKNNTAKLEKTFKDTTNAVKAYNAETDSAKADALIQETGVLIQGYDALIQSAKQARDALAAKAKVGGRLTADEAKQLLKLNAEIDNVRNKRQKLIDESQAKGLVLPVEIVGEKEVEGSINGLKGRLKSLEEEQTNLPIGTAEFQAASNKIFAIKTALEQLEKDPTQLKVELEYQANLADLKIALERGKALIDNVKAQGDLENSIFGVARGYLSYRAQKEQEFLDKLKERKAGENEIKAQEARIAEIKKADEELERQAAIARFNNLTKVQEQERAILDLNQKQRRIEAEKAVFAAKAAEAKQKAAIAEAKAAVLREKADVTRKGSEGGTAITAAEQERLNLLQQIVDLNNQSLLSDSQQVAIAQRYLNSLSQIESLERSTLGLQQQTARNQQTAELASLGVASAVKEGQSALGQTAFATREVTVGFININGKAVELKNTVQTLKDTAIKPEDLGLGRSLTDGANSAVTSIIKIGAAVNELESGTLGGFDDLTGQTSELQAAAEGLASVPIDDNTSTAVSAASDLTSQFSAAKTEVDNIVQSLSSLDGSQINVGVNLTNTSFAGRWAGGPTVAGQKYRVNELGKESFLSASGRLSMINKPKNAIWRAPSSGTVIPAHLTSMLQIPRTGVKMTADASSRVSRMARSANSASGISRAISSALKGVAIDTGNDYNARAQAAQAAQLGKLTVAINELTRKNWNVDVKVRNTGSTAYLDALSKRL